MRNSSLTLLGFSIALVLLAGCAGPVLQNQNMLRGFNAMQHESMAWDNPQARRSLKRLAAVGSNAVVFISFLEQDSPDSVTVRRSDSVTHRQLKHAIMYAHDIGLDIILKPQMLVSGSWAGAIAHDQPEQLHAWFESYSREIVASARFASQHGVHGFVIGTELSGVADRVDWPGLIKRVRAVYQGKLTYAAHNVDGVKGFRFWNKLDTVSLTFYPSLGISGEKADMQRYIDTATRQLQVAVEGINRPLWVLEVGMPSAQGASEKPWQWQHLEHAVVDLELQKDALDIWIKALDKPWIDGVFIWTWYSDVTAGGLNDADYTPQNKPAEYIIRRYWES